MDKQKQRQGGQGGQTQQKRGQQQPTTPGSGRQPERERDEEFDNEP